MLLLTSSSDIISYNQVSHNNYSPAGAVVFVCITSVLLADTNNTEILDTKKQEEQSEDKKEVENIPEDKKEAENISEDKKEAENIPEDKKETDDKE